MAWFMAPMLANMLIEDLPCRSQKAVRDTSKDLFCHPHFPTSSGGGRLACRISPIGQLRSGSTPALLEGDQARVVGIRATEIELASSVPLSFLDRIPEQEMHAAETVEPLVGTSVLVHEHIFEG